MRLYTRFSTPPLPRAGIRTGLLLLTASAMLVLSGCMALDELDSANAKMANHPGKKKASVEESAAATGGAASKTTPILERSKQWWDEATSFSPAETKSSVVKCRLPGNTQFMDRDDCLSRGGVVSRVSG